MKIFIVWGVQEQDWGNDYHYFYGAFTSEERAEEIRKSLEDSCPDSDETFVTTECSLDVPDETYYDMLSEQSVLNG